MVEGEERKWLMWMYIVGQILKFSNRNKPPHKYTPSQYTHYTHVHNTHSPVVGGRGGAMVVSSATDGPEVVRNYKGTHFNSADYNYSGGSMSISVVLCLSHSTTHFTHHTHAHI